MDTITHELAYLELGDAPRSVGWVCTCGKKGKAVRGKNSRNDLDEKAIELHEAHVRRMGV